MTGEFVHEIKGKVRVHWLPESKAILDTWESQVITVAEFREFIAKGLEFSVKNGGRAWIVDASSATGVMPQEVQAHIANEVFPAFVKNGVKYFCSIQPKGSALAKMTVAQYKENTTQHGLILSEAENVEDAVNYLKLKG